MRDEAEDAAKQAETRGDRGKAWTTPELTTLTADRADAGPAGLFDADTYS